MSDNDRPSGLGDYVALLRRRWLLVATIVPAFILVAVMLAFGLPVLYRSTATLILQPSSIQQEFIATTVTTYADQQIELVQGRIMDVPTLEKLIEKFDPYPNQKDLGPREKAEAVISNTEIERVDAVTLEPLKKSNAFSLHYNNPDRKLAAEWAQHLADLFLTYHQKVRAEAAQQATALLQQQGDGIARELEKVDQEVSQLRTKYGNALPDSQDRNQASRDRAERDLETLDRELRSAQEKQSLLEIQLSALSPRMLTRSGDLTDLATVRAQLAEAQQKYTPDHPDVKRLQRAMEALQAQGAKDPGRMRADNPEYLRVEGQLDAARREVAGLRASAERTRNQLLQYSGAIRAAPEIARQYQELDRRLESLRDQYQQIQGKLGAARLGQLVESEQQGERFAMVRPPVMPSRAYSPNQIGLILLGVVLGMAVCAIALAIVESSDPTVRGTKDMKATERWTLLGAVPEIMLASDRRRRFALIGSLGAAYAVGIAICLGLATRAGAEDLPHKDASDSASAPAMILESLP